MKSWAILVVNGVLGTVFMLASVVLQVSLIKARTFFTFSRFYFHLLLPFITIFFFINIGWRVGLISLFVWALGLAFTPVYIRFERRAERAGSVQSARSGIEPLVYLRSFAASGAMRGIEDLLEQSANSYEPSDDFRFQLNPIALGRDDGTGIPKFTTPDREWWQHFEELTEKAAAIFLLPVVAHVDPEAGILREMAHVFRHHAEKLIVIVPDTGRWQGLPRAPGESFDAVTRWNEVRDYLRTVHPGVSAPDYKSSGFIFYLTHSGKSGLKCHTLALSSEGVKTALSKVTLKEREESKARRKDFEAEFKVLNGVSYSDYYAQPGKRPPPILPM